MKGSAALLACLAALLTPAGHLLAGEGSGPGATVRVDSLNGGGAVGLVIERDGAAGRAGASIGQAPPLGVSRGGGVTNAAGFWAVIRAATRPAACAGDCDGDGMVTVDELIRGVNIALGNAALDDCAAFDRSGDGAVTVDELVGAVGNALNGCPTG